MVFLWQIQAQALSNQLGGARILDVPLAPLSRVGVTYASTTTDTPSTYSVELTTVPNHKPQRRQDLQMVRLLVDSAARRTVLDMKPSTIQALNVNGEVRAAKTAGEFSAEWTT